MKDIILASSSPRRIEIFSLLSIPFSYKKSSYREIFDRNIPLDKLVKKNAYGKALDIAKGESNALVLGFDTLVTVKNKILGKPKTKSQAKKMLKLLSNKCHLVYTGCTIIDTANYKTVAFSSCSKVYMKALSQKEIDAYVHTKEPLDKAGAYAIQGIGGMFIKKIEGDYLSIVGFPLSKLYEILYKKYHINLLLNHKI